MRIALPVTGETLCQHFGHCESFVLFDISAEGGEVVGRSLETPPPHAPGVLPRWLSEKGVNVVLAGGMGAHAQSLFADAGIRVLTGAPAAPADQVVKAYLDGTLRTGTNACDH